MTTSRPRPPDDVFFPVVPMLDMSFQLLAFFIMTFQAPSRETRIDLELPTAAVALPGSTAAGAAERPELIGLETDLLVRAESDAAGRLSALSLNRAPLVDAAMLADRLARYTELMSGRPVRVTLEADEGLAFEEAARLLGACSSAGVESVHLAPAEAQQ